MQLKTPWKDYKYIEKFKVYLGIQLLIELEIDVGRQGNQEVFIEILVYAGIN